MPRLDHDHTGARIAHYRKLAGLTQRELALRVSYSYSLLHQVESGHKAASLDLVSAVARVLRIDVTALTGQPYVTELQQDRPDGLIRPIREALDLYDLGADPDLTTRTTGQLVDDADDLCQLVRATRLNQAARALPQLIAEVTTAAHRTPSATLWKALASTYRTAHDITVKLGFYDLSTIALDRMDWAAHRASDPLLAAVRQYMRALVYFREGEHTIGLRLIGAGRAVLNQAEESIESLAVGGQLHLGATIIAARAHDEDAVEAHLSEARGFAERTGEAGQIHWLSFGPTNVSAHEVSAKMELGHFGAAMAKAKEVSIPKSWALSRRAHFYIDRARSEMETGHTDAALGSLIEARRLAPQQTRYHSGARETIRGLVHLQRRSPDTLTHMAAWIGQ
ncbi:helix-turn-helix domain-containing protein [Streptomyces varsoviensis]|uniref:DNA-binding protein n=1 Tax=Streptomyces varsoviensis TaxID=67373 RepID=A0ABR5J900_9ACTN|nr:helix-turn-helix transcriptional regulator [Streptomyces varsoviensis]KOG89591.1 DNA-binding protein [Streptomyces varsoviensis]